MSWAAVRLAAMALLCTEVVLASACGGLLKRSESYEVGTRERGIASWYGKDYHGRPTASGEIYDMHGLTAAHRTMPLRSTIRVTNRNNGRTVTLRMNDRGPFIRGRTLDVSYGAAVALGFAEAGLAPVEYEVLVRGGPSRPGRRAAPPGTAPKLVTEEDASGPFTVQIGAFTDEAYAKRMKARLESHEQPVRIERYETNEATYYRVQVGVFTSEREAEATAEHLETSNRDLEGFVTRSDR